MFFVSLRKWSKPVIISPFVSPQSGILIGTWCFFIFSIFAYFSLCCCDSSFSLHLFVKLFRAARPWYLWLVYLKACIQILWYTATFIKGRLLYFEKYSERLPTCDGEFCCPEVSRHYLSSLGITLASVTVAWLHLLASPHYQFNFSSHILLVELVLKLLLFWTVVVKHQFSAGKKLIPHNFCIMNITVL